MSPLWITSLFVIFGTAIVWRALGRGDASTVSRIGYTVGFGPLVGTGLASLTVFYARLLHLPPPGAGTFLILASVLTFLAGRWKGSQRPEPFKVGRPLGPWDLVTVLALVIGAVVLWKAFHVIGRSWPDGTWDAVAIWNSRARLLTRGYWDFPDLLRHQYPGTMPDYPLLLPGVVSAYTFALGRESLGAPVMFQFVGLLGLGLLLFSATSELGDRVFAALAVTLVWTAQNVWEDGLGQGADVLVSYALLATVVGLLSRLPQSELRPLPFWLTGFSLGLLAWSKNEGLVMAAYCGLAFVAVGVTAGRRVRETFGAIWRLAAGAAPGIVAILLFKSLWAPTSGLQTFLRPGSLGLLRNPDRWQTPVKALVDRFLPVADNFGWYGIWPVLLAGAALVFWVNRGRLVPSHWFWATIVTTTVASWMAIYAITPYDQVWHVATSLDRLMVQAYPLVILGVFGFLGSSRQAPKSVGPLGVV